MLVESSLEVSFVREDLLKSWQQGLHFWAGFGEDPQTVRVAVQLDLTGFGEDQQTVQVAVQLDLAGQGFYSQAEKVYCWLDLAEVKLL